MSQLTNFERVKVQMEYVVPLIKDLQAILGEDVVNDALAKRIEQNLEKAESNKTADFGRMVEGTKFFAAGDALEYDIIASDTDRFDMNVTQCRYADMMNDLGARAFGHLLVCGGDFEAAKKIGMTLERQQTRMQGAEYCDFRYSRRG